MSISPSGWEATAVPAPATTALNADVRTKVAIIGAGYTGLAAALALAAQGGEPVVLEAGSVGFGASGRNGGQVIPGLKYDPDTLATMVPPDRAAALVAFAGSTATRTFELVRKYQLRCEAADDGWIQPAHSARQLRTVTERARQWQRHCGIEPTFLDGAAVKRLVGTDVYRGGWIDPRGGQLQPLSYARELARVAMAAGARIHTGSRVSAMVRDGERWRLAVNGHTVSADKVIVATNAYADGLVPGLAPSIIVANSIQTSTEPLPASLRREVLPAGLPVSDARRLLVYFRFDPAGRFVIGARGSFGAHQPESYFARLRRRAIEMFPALSDVRWDATWGGPFALTLDHLPHIHVPAPGLFASLGCNGRGVALASQLGGLLADLCNGAPAESLPLPVTAVSPIPLHFLRRPALEGAALWFRVLDAAGA